MTYSQLYVQHMHELLKFSKKKLHHFGNFTKNLL